jgi:hypothetical protein
MILPLAETNRLQTLPWTPLTLGHGRGSPGVCIAIRRCMGSWYSNPSIGGGDSVYKPPLHSTGKPVPFRDERWRSPVFLRAIWAHNGPRQHFVLWDFLEMADILSPQTSTFLCPQPLDKNRDLQRLVVYIRYSMHPYLINLITLARDRCLPHARGCIFILVARRDNSHLHLPPQSESLKARYKTLNHPPARLPVPSSSGALHT